MRMRTVIIFIILSCLGTAFPFAGVIIEQKTRIDPVRLQGRDIPAREYTEKIFLENDRMRLDNSTGKNETLIIRGDEQKIYIINHAQKTVMTVSLPLRPTPEMERMFLTMRLKCQLQKTGAKKKIGAYSCEEAILNVAGYMNVRMTLWCSAEPPIPFGRYYELNAMLGSFSPAIRDVGEQMKALGGVYPVLQITEGEIMGTRTRSETRLTNVRKDISIPADQFLPPAGYSPLPFETAGGGNR